VIPPIPTDPHPTEAYPCSGLRRSCGPDQGEENVWKGSSPSWWSRDWKDSSSIGRVTRAGNQSAFLPNRGKRGVFHRSQKDRSFDGELSKGHWYGNSTRSKAIIPYADIISTHRSASTRKKGSLRGRSHRACPRRSREPPWRLWKDDQPSHTHTEVCQRHKEATIGSKHLRSNTEGKSNTRRRHLH
jgi:hypothetical protein